MVTLLTHESQAFNSLGRGPTRAGGLEKRIRTKERTYGRNRDELEHFLSAYHYRLPARVVDLPDPLHPAALPALSGADGL